jgi:hypothetical protein
MKPLTNTTPQTDRFYGFTENRRELDMDMREMVDKVKRGEELYGKSQLTEYMQGAASRQSRYGHLDPHDALVQLCQSQPARCRYRKVLSTG